MYRSVFHTSYATNEKEDISRSKFAFECRDETVKQVFKTYDSKMTQRI